MGVPAQSTPSSAISPGAAVGAVRLTVSDLARSRTFYERAIGLQSFEPAGDGVVQLGVEPGHPLIELHGDSDAPPLNPRASGLFHLAILVPSRRDLAFALARLADARWPLDGASDHLVSEALYLSDPDGIGIEIYRDRPREQWRRSAGQLQMATLPLDLESLIDEIGDAGERQARAPEETRIGHVHLQVADLGTTEDFYHRVLGLDVTVRAYPGAVFLSAGGYHHHVGANTWRSAGAAPPPPGSIGLHSFEITLPSSSELGQVLDRARAAGVEVASSDSGPLLRDPSGNRVVLRAS